MNVRETNLTRLINDELNCPVCWELFREPRSLNCGHTFCYGCLESIVELSITRDFYAGFQRRRPIIRCPACRHVTEVPPDGIERLPVNYIVRQLVDLNTRGYQEIHEIEDKLAQSKVRLDEMQNCIDTLEVTIAKTQENRLQVVAEIHQWAGILVESVRRREQELLNRCSYFAAEKLRVLRSQERGKKTAQNTLKSIVDSVENRLSSLFFNEINQQLKDDMIHELEEGEMVDDVTEPVDDYNIKFIASTDEDFIARLSQFGDIRTSGNHCQVIPRPVFLPRRAIDADVIKVIDQNDCQFEDEQRTFVLPWGVALGTEDDIFVADHVNNRVQVFDPNGNFKSSIIGVADNHFRLPTSIAISNDGNLFVLDSGNYCIKEISPTGALIRVIGRAGDGNGELGDRAEGISIDSESRMIVADSGNNRIQVFHHNGRYAMKFGDNGNHKLTRPSFVVYHKGKFIVSDTLNNCLKFFDRHGLFLREVGKPGKDSGQFNHPRGIAVDSNDNIFVCDSGNCRIQVLDFEGNFVIKFGTMGEEEGQFCLPFAIAINSQGHMVVTDCNNNRIQVLHFSGSGTTNTCT